MQILTKDIITADIMDYISGYEFPDIYDNAMGIIHQASIDWNNAPCDAEGTTAEQEANLDNIIDNAVDEVYEILQLEER